MDFILFLTGMAIGLSVSAPLGPVNILAIRNAIERGFGVAFAVGLGAVAADLIYAVIAACGIRSIAHLITAHANVLMILGGVLLVAIGLRLARPEVSLAPPGDAGGGRRRRRPAVVAGVEPRRVLLPKRDRRKELRPRQSLDRRADRGLRFRAADGGVVLNVTGGSAPG